MSGEFVEAAYKTKSPAEAGQKLLQIKGNAISLIYVRAIASGPAAPK
jgi:hypothetical protein